MSLERSSLMVEEVFGEGLVDEDGAENTRAGFARKEGCDVEGGECCVPTSER